MSRLKERILSVRAIGSVVLAAVILVGVIAATPAEAQYFGKNKIRYDDFEWEIYHSTHFDVYFYKEELVLLEKVVVF